MDFFYQYADYYKWVKEGLKEGLRGSCECQRGNRKAFEERGMEQDKQNNGANPHEKKMIEYKVDHNNFLEEMKEKERICFLFCVWPQGRHPGHPGKYALDCRVEVAKTWIVENDWKC